jgi:hypothetical protein
MITNILKPSKLVKVVLMSVLLIFGATNHVSALGSSQNPQNGSTGVQGEILAPAPKSAPSITVPANGQVFTSIPITVSGLCTGNLLVKLFSNGVFLGSTTCASGSYSMQVDLFGGRNDLVASQYDALNQESPVSSTTSVVFDDAQFAKLGTHVFLTSDYARRGANPGETLTWPISISGGSGPYAISADWGDGKPAELVSQLYSGTVNLQHVYDSAGTYAVIVKATDANGESAYLQVVGVANGNAAQQNSTSSGNGKTTVVTKILWWPGAVLLVLAIVNFWLGRRYELSALRKRIEEQQ